VDRRRLQAAAAEYPYLRGLFGIPLGALFLVSALGNWRWGPLRHDWVFVVAVLVIAGLFAAIKRYYDDRYGRVTPSARNQFLVLILGAAAVAVMIGLTTLLRSRAVWSLDLPVNPIPVAFGLFMLGYYAVLVDLRVHHVVIWGSLVVVGLLPVWDGADPGNVGLVLTGAAAVVNGVFDHLALVRSFAAARVY
jgi:hypothetical protein